MKRLRHERGTVERSGLTAVRFGLLIAWAISLGMAAELQAQKLPDQISDEAFWQMVTEFSEPGQSFTDNNSDNVLSNEAMYQSVIPALLEMTRPGGAYLGVGPEQNFTYMAALKSRIGFVLDIRRENMLELLMYKALFELSNSRVDFMSRLFSRRVPPALANRMIPATSVDDLFSNFSRLLPNKQYFKQNFDQIRNYLVNTKGFPLTEGDIDEILYAYSAFYFSGPNLDFSAGTNEAGAFPTYAYLMTAKALDGKQYSYLASEDNFHFIQGLQKRNMIIPLVGDFAGPKALRAVAQYLVQHETPVSAFYVSNVEQYLLGGFGQPVTAPQFYSSVEALPRDAGSTFIRSANQKAAVGLFVSVLSSINQTLAAYKEGRVRTYADLMGLSK
jgi:hypothetical protein